MQSVPAVDPGLHTRSEELAGLLRAEIVANVLSARAIIVEEQGRLGGR